MTDQTNAPDAGLQRADAQGPYRPTAAAARAGRNRTLLFSELGSLAGAPPSSGTVFRLLRVLVRAVRLFRDRHDRELW